MKDVTLILQGKVEPEQMELWKKNYKDWNVIVSTWEDVDFNFRGGFFSKWLPKKWKLVINKYPLVRFRSTSNLDYQILTTLGGLEQVNTKWVIKARCDEYWSNLDKVVDKMKMYPNKIITSSMYFRKWGMYKFHISDKIIAGTTDNLFLMFESTLHNIELNFYNSPIPESQLGLGFVVGKEKGLNLDDIKHRLNLELLPIYNSDETSTYTELSDIMSKIVNSSMELLTQDLLKLQKNPDWNSAKKKLEYISQLSGYCINKIDRNNFGVYDDKSLMRKWFEIVDVNELKPYISTRSNGGKNGGRIYYRDNFVNEKEDSMTNIHQD